MTCNMHFVAGKSQLTRGEHFSVITDGVGIERIVVELTPETLFIPIYYRDLDANKIAVSLRPEKKVGFNNGAPAAETIE